MALVRWSPARELAGMEIDRLNRMFSDLYGEAFGRGWVPATRQGPAPKRYFGGVVPVAGGVVVVVAGGAPPPKRPRR